MRSRIMLRSNSANTPHIWNELHALYCHLYLHQQALDTSTPSGRAMFRNPTRSCGLRSSRFDRVERHASGLVRVTDQDPI
jgi:hypothetical protein